MPSGKRGLTQECPTVIAQTHEYGHVLYIQKINLALAKYFRSDVGQ